MAARCLLLDRICAKGLAFSSTQAFMACTRASRLMKSICKRQDAEEEVAVGCGGHCCTHPEEQKLSAPILPPAFFTREQEVPIVLAQRCQSCLPSPDP